MVKTGSVNIDIKLNNEWLEICGCGIINRKIISENHIGFAIGGGLERLIMLKHQIIDIRKLYNTEQITI